jgi:AraC-like DNA-binding protein
MRAKALLASGVKPSDLAPQLGLYDQSQLNRHFLRIVGTTPGRYARSI